MWVGLKPYGVIRSHVDTITKIASRFPNPCLAGFSDGATMAQYCAAYNPIFSFYVIHSGLVPKFGATSLVMNQKLFLVQGSNDRYRMIRNAHFKLREIYGRKNQVFYTYIHGLGHNWYRPGNVEWFQ